jgi:transcriptional antiterminator NusG
MELNDATWHTVHDTPRITGFVGDSRNPQPLTEKEAQKIIGRIEEGATTPKPKVVFEEGDLVRVVEGPFANFQGVIDEVYPDKGRVKVMVSIFGRSTPVELEYIQVSKN